MGYRWPLLGMLGGAALGFSMGGIWPDPVPAREGKASGEPLPRRPDPVRISEEEQTKRKEAEVAERREKNQVMMAEEKAIRERADEFLAAVNSEKDPLLRDRAMEKVREAISSEDRLEARAGLLALERIEGIFDRDRFREVLLEKLDSTDPMIRLAACGALMNGELRDGDWDRLLSALRATRLDERAAWMATNLLTRMGAGKMDPVTWEIYLKWLRESNPRTVEGLIKSVGALVLPPGVESELLGMIHDPEVGRDALRRLSHQPGKGPMVVDEMIRRLGSPDLNLAWFMASNLQNDVPDSSRRKIADAAASIVELRISGQLYKEAWELLEKYGTAEDLPRLRKLSERSDLETERREKLAEAIRKIEAKEVEP